jgi:hypothetical protein
LFCADEATEGRFLLLQCMSPQMAHRVGPEIDRHGRYRRDNRTTLGYRQDSPTRCSAKSQGLADLPIGARSGLRHHSMGKSRLLHEFRQTMRSTASGAARSAWSATLLTPYCAPREGMKTARHLDEGRRFPDFDARRSLELPCVRLTPCRSAVRSAERSDCEARLNRPTRLLGAL